MRQKAVALILAVLLFVGFASAFWYSKSQTALAGVQGVLTEELAKALGSEAAVGSLELVSYNKIVLHDVAVRSGGDLLAGGARITVVFDPLALLQGAVNSTAVTELILEEPQIYLSRQSDGRWNVDELLQRTRSDDSTFSGKITIQNGMVTIKMPEGRWALSAINGGLDFASKPAVIVKMAAAYEGLPVDLAGRFSKEGSSALEVKAAGFSLDALLPLVPDQFAVKLLGGKVSNLDLAVRREHGDITYAGEARLDSVAVDIAEVPVREIRGLITFTDKDIHLFGTTAQASGQTIQVHGKIATAAAAPLLDLTVSAKEFDLAAVVPGMPVSGPLNFTAMVTGPLAEPAIYAEVNLEQGEVAGYPVQGAVAKLGYSGNAVQIIQLDADAFDGRIAASGSLDILSRQFHINFRGRGLDVGALPQVPEGFTGHGDVDLALDGVGDVAGANIIGTVKLGAGSINGVRFADLTGGIAKTGDHIALDYLTVGFGPGVLTGRGTIDSDLVNLTFVGQGIPLARFAAQSPGLILDGTADGEGTITGTMANPQVAARFTAYNGQAYYQPYAWARGRVAASKDRLELADMEAVNGVTKHRIQGAIALSGDHQLDVTISSSRARAEDIVKLIMPGERLTGNVDNEIRITGPAGHLTAEGRVKMTEGSFRGQLIAKAEGSYRHHDGVTDLNDFSIYSLNTQVKLDGQIAAGNQLDLNVTAKDIDIAALRYQYPYPVTGRANFAGKLTGTATNPLFDGEVTADSIKLNNQELQAIVGKISINGPQVDIPAFHFSQKGGQFHFAGGLNTGSEAIYGKLDAENGSMASLLDILNLPAKNIDGRLDGQVTIQGTMARPSIWLVGTLTKGKIKNYSLDSIEVDVALENNVATINRFYAKQGTGVLAARGTAAVNGPLDLEIGGHDIDAGLLTAWFDSTVDTRGKLQFAAQITGTAPNPHAAVSLEITGGGVANATFDSLYGLFVLDNNSITVNQLMLIKGPYRASAYGTIPLAALSKQGRAAGAITDQMDLKVRLEQADLSILPLLTQEVAWAAGETTGQVTIGGTLAQPLLYGGFAVKNGTVKLASLSDPIQKVGVDIQFAGDTINIKTFDGSMGQGAYRLTGSAILRGLSLQDYNMLLVLDNLGVSHRNFKGPVNGTLVLATNGGKPSLSGKIIFENTTANIPAFPEFTPTGLDVSLDLELLVQKKVHLYDPNLYDLWVDGRLKFAGTTQSPTVAGRINVVRGTVNYLRTQFKVDDGSAEFTQFGSLMPVIRLTAETSLERTKVNLVASGPLNAMEFRMTSEPAMSQQEILSLLTLRSRYTDKQNAAGGSRDTGLGRDEVVSLLNSGLQMRFLTEAESTVRNYLGVDDFHLVRGTLSSDSGQNGSTGTAAGAATNGPGGTEREVYSLAVSKYVNDRLQVGYTMGVDHQESTLSLRYDLSRRVSFTASQDQFGRKQVGIETRFNF